MSSNTDQPATQLAPSESEGTGSKKNLLPPKKLARILAESDVPFYLLDSDDRLRFASRSMVEALKITPQELDGLDCRRTLSTDEHSHPTIAALLAIPDRLANGRIEIAPIGSLAHALAPWTSRMVIPLAPAEHRGYVACFWLRDDDPLVQQAARHIDWTERAAVRDALLEARSIFLRLDGLHCLIGNSPSAQLARRQTQAAIAGTMPVSIFGPGGSGKTSLARAIYHHRRKRDRKMLTGGRLLPIDCRLMDRSLIQETLELAAEGDPSSRSDAANEPTAILLTSLELLPLDAVAPLLKYFAANPQAPVFSTSRSVDLASNHRETDWQALIAHLDVMRIQLAPLIHRIEDIAPLAESILEEIRVASSGQIRKILSGSTLAWLQAYPWPGNFRELNQGIHDACKKSTQHSIEPHDFSLAIRTFASHALKPEPLAPIHLDQALEQFERSILQKAIAAFPRNRAAAARFLGISRTRLLRRLAQLGFEPSPLETDSDETPENREESSDGPVFEEIPDEP